MAAPAPSPVLKANPTTAGQYVPTPEEEAALQAIPRAFLKFGGLGFAGASVATHFTLRALLGSAIKKSYGLRYGAPIGFGALAGIIWGVQKMKTQIEHLIFDLPPSPLTVVYSKRFLQFSSSSSPKTDKTEVKSDSS